MELDKSIFVGWDKSSTGEWQNADDLIWLRDTHPKDMAEAFIESGFSSFTSALYELLAHANYRKAALIARNMVELQPECRKEIERNCKPVVDLLFNVNLLKLPSKLSEMKFE